MLAKPVRCKMQSIAYSDFLEHYGVRFDRLSKAPYSRYQVLQKRKVADGSFDFFSIGICFRQGCIWMFVPSKYPSNPGQWFFGQTRLDVLAGYFASVNQEVN